MIVWHLSFSPVCKFDWSVTSLLIWGPSVAMAPLFMRGSSVAMAPLLMWGSSVVTASLLMQGPSVAGPSLQGKSRELASCLKIWYVTPCKVFQFQTYTWLGVLRLRIVDTPKQ